ncbi:hypothetical protein [Arthrobacter sp. M4]|nr:hypothetical protein [Arthrobacter sp. M4]MCA4135412.1 hypothetical protein [Arthrobacter sp. M4]
MQPFTQFEIDTPAPHGGTFALPTRPGFGIEFEESRIKESQEILDVS